MRKIAIPFSPLGTLDIDKIAACIPGPASEKPLGLSGSGVVLSPLVIKLPFDNKIRHELIVISYFAEQEHSASTIYLLTNPSVLEKNLLWNSTSSLDPDKALALIHHPRLVDISPQQAFKLIPCRIPKPWGEEVWFTGIEDRGVSGVELAPGLGFELPVLLQSLGDQAIENQKNPILLKILSPKPNALTGSLYYELHKEKQEVYIVSEVNPEAWPKGVGRMKYGISEAKKKEFPSEKAFLDAFKALCLSYEQTRREIDSFLDECKAQEGFAPNDHIPDSKLEQWLATLPEHLKKTDQSQRSEIESFVGWLDLKVGDVVQVETLVPHSLQYGITVIEFQTPVYERLIITFNQKVLTQKHWDVEKAFEVMRAASPTLRPLPRLKETDEVLIERAVDFDSFEVLRVKQSAKNYDLTLDRSGHSLIFALDTPITIHGKSSLTLNPGESCLIPRAASKLTVSSDNPEATWLFGHEISASQKD